MVDEPKKSTDDEKSTDTTAIVKPEESTEEAEAIDMLEGLPTQEKKIVFARNDSDDGSYEARESYR